MPARGWNMSTTTDRTNHGPRRPIVRKAGRFLLGAAIVLVVALLVGLAAFRIMAMVRESAPVAPPAETARFTTVDGLRVHYMEWGDPNGPKLLLVHGTLAWSRTWRDIAGPLGERGFHVIAPDLPPFGYSERPQDHDYSRAAQSRRILGFADAIGLERFALGVHSYGGGAAIEAAFSAPERIEALILLDVALGLNRPPSSGPPLAGLLSNAQLRNVVVAATFTNPLMIGPGLRDFIHDDSVVTDERIALYRAPLSQPGTTEAVGRWLFTGLFNDESAARSADVGNYYSFDTPVLVIWGRQDTVTPLEQGEFIAASFAKGRLDVLDGVNHIPHVEDPGRVFALIEPFLRQQPPELGPLRLGE